MRLCRIMEYLRSSLLDFSRSLYIVVLLKINSQKIIQILFDKRYVMLYKLPCRQTCCAAQVAGADDEPVRLKKSAKLC